MEENVSGCFFSEHSVDCVGWGISLCSKSKLAYCSCCNCADGW